MSQMRAGEAPDVSPPPDGAYGGNTAEGYQTLFHLTSGGFNSGLGWRSLYTLTTGSFNTGVGAGTLAVNNAAEDTATGTGALLLNTTGEANTANGALSLLFNSSGEDNSAFGDRALLNNTTGNDNTALGSGALHGNNTGGENTAVGTNALTTNTTGSFNIALGILAGVNLTTGDNNIDIGSPGAADESDTIRLGIVSTHQAVFVAGISAMVPEVPLEAVIVDPATGQLGRANFASLPVGGLPAVLFDFNTGTIVIGVGGAVPFSQAPLLVGTAISKNNNTTFMVNEGGVYRVSYTLRTALASLLANVQLHVNGVGIGPTAALVVAGTSLSDQVTFMANAGDTLQLVVGGVALTLGTGDNATINIDKLQ